MTRKDYEMLASLVVDSFNAGVFTEKRKGQFANMTADRLEKENPRFNRYTFLKACGVV